MIKVNLLKNIAAQASSPTKSMIVLTKEEKIGLASRAAILMILPIAQMIYQNANINDLQLRLSQAKRANEEVAEKKKKFGDVAGRVKQFTADKEKIDKQLDTARKLASNRLREVKALDAVQSLMPQKAWLQEVKITGNKVALHGYAVNDDGVPELLKALQGSIFFSHIEPKATTSEKLDGATVKKFEIDMLVGTQEEAVNE